MTIERICQRNVDLASGEETVQIAAQRMRVRNVGSLVVLDDNEHPVGILTDRDLATEVVGPGHDPREVLVREVMTDNPATVTEHTAIEEALGVMRSAGVRRLPVIGWDKKLIGMVTLDDVITHISSELGDLSSVLSTSSPQRLAEE